MKKLLSTITAWVVLLTFFGCDSKPDIPDYPFSQPTSISGLRRVEVKSDLQFGQTQIVAVVTSDAASKNIEERTVIVQDRIGDAAIVLELTASAQSFLLGDEVTINLEGAQLIERNGELTVTGLSGNQLEKTGNTVQVAAKQTNIPALLANAAYWGPIVVRLDKINIHNDVGNTLSGKLSIDDEIVSIYTQFLSESVFTNEVNPEYVETFIGILRVSGSDIYVNPRNFDDIQVGMLQLIEDFEQATSTDYNTKVMDFVTGSWTISGGITAGTAADPKNGAQSIRLQGTVGNPLREGIIAMEFDLVGVQSISISYGIYPAAAETGNVNPTVFDIEISHDEGATYSLVGTVEVDVDLRELRSSTFPINAGFSEKVRFRIVNSSIPFANGNLPRINIDDFVFNF